MNPQNNIPQGQPAAGSYGANAGARAMAAAQPAARPMQVPPATHPNARPLQQPGALLQQTPTPMTNTSYQSVPVQPQAPATPQAAAPQVPFNQQQAALGQQAIASMTTNTAPTPAPVTENPLSTQATLMFSELRDSLIIMKDGSFRAVVACQSINFDLMSEQEREGVEYSYQNFLNSLNFTVQILVRSQRVDIGPYIEHLTKLRRDNDNMLLGVLMDDYINFIDVLSQEANIMDKSFFVVIPYYSSADAEKLVQDTKNFFKTFGKNNKSQNVTRINRDVYNKAIDELNNRVESVISGLFQIGIQSVRLNTRELSELLYNFNNPDTAVREPLVDFTSLATTYVKKGVKTNE